jgi:two-component system CheB/CheR fusion protein
MKIKRAILRQNKGVSMKENRQVVVGIGSSAGGLEALQTLLSNLPEIENCAYVIVQHLSPTHKSMMVELLARTTNLPVLEVKNGLLIKSKTIYVTPENTDIYVKNSKLYLKTVEEAFGPKPSVNYFLSSLAQDYGNRAIGIILSGTGSDGAYGIRAVKAEGGITIAQAPATAKYDGMPLSAINTGKVDLVVPIDKLGVEIESVINALDKNIELTLNDHFLQQIYRILFEEYGVDFSLYKKNTFVRRIERRLAALKIETLKEYLEVLKSSKHEADMLYHDILIGVTAFFRDKDAYEELHKQIRAIVAKKEQGEEIRFWSVGCSTGEEAYSIAILLSEILQEKISKYKIKIFATDIDDEALKIARTGLYAETSLNGVEKEIIQKYFHIKNNQFEIKKELRELVIFSKHNIVSDSPFLRIDLISCRNMLIYFSTTLQNKFFPIAHYALNANGILFLGKSESVGQHIDLFNIIDKSSKIFKSQFTGLKEAPKLYNFSSLYKDLTLENEQVSKSKNEEEFLEDLISDAVRNVVLEKVVAVNSSNEIIYIKGDIPYVKPREGKVSNNIFKQLDNDLGLDVRSALNKANKEKTIQYTPYRSIKVFEDIIRYVRVMIAPVEDEKSDDWLYILFFQSEESQNFRGQLASVEGENEIIAKLSSELDSTKSHLQNVIEELEASYEEMQSLNEELQSSNEELQSSNEELETTNEELQSTNEELQTAYSELKELYDEKEKRTEELETLTEKLSAKTEEYRKQKELTEGILHTAPIAIVMVDENGNLTFANSYASGLFKMSADELTSKKYNSKDWKFSYFSGEDFPKEELPFSVIQHTYEPVYNIQHTIENNKRKIYVSINGAPLFSADGKFLGAVFCIQDLTESFQLKNDVSYYKESLNTKLYNNPDHRNRSLLESSLLDLDTSIRNALSEISLELNTVKGIDTDVDEAIENSNDKLNEVSAILQEKVAYYTQYIHYEKESLVSITTHVLDFFNNILKQNLFKCNLKLDPSIDVVTHAKTLHEDLYLLFDLLLNYRDKESKIEYKVDIKNLKKGSKHFIVFDSNIPCEDEKVDLLATFQKQNKAIKISCEKTLQLTLAIKKEN